MTITVIGTGYVGLVTAVMLGSLGHEVICVGRNKSKVQDINKGKAPFFEPGLPEALQKVLDKQNLRATTELTKSVQQSTIIIIAVGTPTNGGKIDLGQIRFASRDIGRAMRKSASYQVVVVKSTVVPGTTENVVGPILEKYSGKRVGEFGLCMNPEFLREGNAVNDAMHPDRIVIGKSDEKSGAVYKSVYPTDLCPLILTNTATAEMIKYVSNSLLATLISFSNEIARICEKTPGVDAIDVWRGLHLDSRLSPMVNGKRIQPGILSYIYSGSGYGGSCFPKDTQALAFFGRQMKQRLTLIETVIGINKTQPHRVILHLKNAIGEQLKGKTIVILGLTFKPDTDDLRESPAFGVIDELLELGAKVVCHDPQAYRDSVPDSLKRLPVKLAKTISDALGRADAAIVLTAWEDYKKLTPAMFKKYMKVPVIIDGRRIYDKTLFISQGIIYRGIGYCIE